MRPTVVACHETGWEDFFNASYLAERRGPLTMAWFEAEPSQAFRNATGEVTALWLGAPGCHEDASRTWPIDTGPNRFEEDGERCYLLYRVVVSLDAVATPQRVWIGEVGGIT